MKHQKKMILMLLILIQSVAVSAKDYKASFFHIKHDGTTLNTRSIQFAIDYIHKNGGGRLVFHVGRYLTGSIHLKSNVTLQLEEGAVLLGSTNPFDYDRIGQTALIHARDLENVGITGKGMIDGQGRALANNSIAYANDGLIEDILKYDRTRESIRPMIIYFYNCTNVTIKDLILQNSACWLQTYERCKNMVIDGITVNNVAFWNSDGIDIVDCDNVVITNNNIDAADDGICLKSHTEGYYCNNILIENNIVRTSANGIKLGTAGKGGFRNIKAINNTVYNTYRSAIALQSVDGGFLEDIVIDGLKSINTGNVIYLRLGERVAGKKSTMDRISIKNVVADVPFEKADAGYDYEGPIEDMPRNISPIIIAGLPGQYINDVTFTNFEVSYPGRGSKFIAYVPLDKLDSIPEQPAQYPEFSQFKEIPAWGIYVRHAKNINFSNIHLTAEKKDYRLPIIMDDVHGAQLKKVTFKQIDQKKLLYTQKSTNIKVD
ncbi:glycoside hydrolase family 28 protein [Pedobacter arcticus]|uniref:glycoside hydrolase family 28 protein n=1 Tax=Pedobacter arcticus TaxID=752140 RepID=UPI0003768E24|nr:glycosyl hydrolase family 28 protein [Pedobacter arcticus]